MSDTRRKNVEWNAANRDGTVSTWERVNTIVLMDIRDELQALNRLLACRNFVGIPQTLRTISRNTAKPKKKAE